ncbi:NAD-dependent epimerase/dehydratase family protein [Methylophilus glucosoxydans]|uniref:NAD-dependent epimerase/dehydratase family protein n=1 Tax=Methylophilus glucosoxydans TaxID=752553 RepID=A0ABW3GK22_9PROT
MSTLLIGGGGFIGSSLIPYLLESGREHIIVVGRSKTPKLTLPTTVKYLSGDISNEVFARKLLSDADEVMDLAYSTVPKTSFDDPIHDVLGNLPSTVNLIKLASEYDLKKFLLVSSGGTVYGNAMYLPIDEAHLTNPVSPYGITKLASEKYALMYQRLAGLPVTIVRPGNPYGINQMPGKGQGFIATAIFQILKNEPVSIFGQNGTIRDYIYINDLAKGILCALENGKSGDIFNIGTGIGYSNRQIINHIIKLASSSKLKLNILPERPFDVAESVLSPAKLTYVSGWRPEFSIEDGLHATLNWARKFIN